MNTDGSNQCIVHDDDELARTIRELYSGSGCVVIDGFDGAGKSRAARSLSRSIGAVHLEVDDFLERDRDGYLKFLRYDVLADAITCQHEQQRRAVVDGVCAKAIMDRLGITEYVHVYVKRMGQHRVWFDRLSHATLDEATLHEENIAPLAGLRRELLSYHYMYRPHEVADVIFERLEG